MALIIISLILSSVAICFMVTLKISIDTLASNIKDLSDNLKDVTGQMGNILTRLETLENPPKFPTIIVDVLGREVIINSEPRRIVSMAPSVTEILFALGVGDRVVGVTSYCNYPPEVLDMVEAGKIEIIGGFIDPNIEKIVALKPDLVIGVTLHERVVRLLESLGLTVIVVGNEDIDDIYGAIQLIGKAVGMLDRAIEIVNGIKEGIRDVWTKVLGASKPKVLIIVWLEPIWVAGRESYMNDLIEFAGGVNAYTGEEGWASIGPESIIAMNPDIIIITGHAAPGKSIDEILKYLENSIPGWENISAVSNNRIYFFINEAEDALVRPGPRIAQVVKILGIILHPEIFGVEAEHVIREVNNNILLILQYYLL